MFEKMLDFWDMFFEYMLFFEVLKFVVADIMEILV